MQRLIGLYIKLLHATCVSLFPIAFAIVDLENSSNWEWSQIVDDSRVLTFVSDHNVGLLQSMSTVFLLAHYAFYLLHLKMNLRDWTKYVNTEHKIGLMQKLRECAYAPTITSFNHKIEILKQWSPTVIGNFLKDLYPQHLANTYFRYVFFLHHVYPIFICTVPFECKWLALLLIVGVVGMVRCGLMLPNLSTTRVVKLDIFPSFSWLMQFMGKSWNKCRSVDLNLAIGLAKFVRKWKKVWYRHSKIVRRGLLAKLMLTSLRFVCTHQC